MKPIRIGEISYTNVLPVFHFFDSSNLPIEWVNHVPATLNQAMSKGEIDLGAISSFAFAEHSDRYYLFPNLSVSAYGPVGSIFLFTKDKSLQELDQASIALTNASASSVNLLRVILEKFSGVKPLYQVMEPNLEQMMQVSDAALLIGDDAIRAAWSKPHYRAYDLGELWFQQTGLPMVFAVWAVRKEIVQKRPELMAEIYDRFMRSKESGNQEPMAIIKAAQRKVGGEVSYWKQYFAGLSHDLGERELEGLQLFYRYATELGTLPPEIAIQMFQLSFSKS
ncbi:chorismate dehydratase [Croceifilum oryzae]|uniref:Chorismate dehydratase n=1 Tax=Croceifilum oryzae TaxID=1553429 RepID=A0AAJ1WUI7_9BACL|nr:menaquinone biosynthesis protein [Croceifilum oryzae]MDQ0418031.1 chorismate dehydratase [Croceifilum oryzae]